MLRINRYIAQCGIASRRSSEAIIKSGRVSVNDQVETNLSRQIDPSKDVVRLDGKIIEPHRNNRYVLLNKPKDYVTTASDERGRKTVFDLVRLDQRLFSVGRLDLNSEGLLLLTDDGELANRLMHPRYKVDKIYRVRLNRKFDPNDLSRLHQGIVLEDGLTAPCKAGFYCQNIDRIEIVLREGRNRQVKRMMEALGYKVKSLKRVRFGPIALGEVARGKWRYLSAAEVKKLKETVGLS